MSELNTALKKCNRIVTCLEMLTTPNSGSMFNDVELKKGRRHG
ncbi:hypothetical protein J2S70_000911 [Trueperella bonasi]|uniref:Uncharacterized protein n=1 Tax=Trueperella bonasi TaxID=312286 RepID=A0ABT9NFZ8_9ACTO|nr:hypothetical protein [Trueperella bonasi]